MPLSHALFVTTAATAVKPISVKSPAFSNLGSIPQKFSSAGENTNPQLNLGKIPAETQSLVLLVEDTNAPADTWVHWLVWNIKPATVIKEGVVPGIEGLNAFQRHHYQGPGSTEYARFYSFKIYALDTTLHLHYCSGKYDVMKAIKDHVIGFGELTGTYCNSQQVKMTVNTAPEIYY